VQTLRAGRVCSGALSSRCRVQTNIRRPSCRGQDGCQTRITRAIGVALGMGADARFENMYLLCNAPDTQQRPCKGSIVVKETDGQRGVVRFISRSGDRGERTCNPAVPSRTIHRTSTASRVAVSSSRCVCSSKYALVRLLRVPSRNHAVIRTH
jgi:hypothetical protein